MPEIHQKKYYSCYHCQVIFLDESQILSNEEQFKRYQLHTHHSDHGLREYLQPAFAAIQEVAQNFKEKEIHLLDFGSGPHPPLKSEIQNLNINYESYDLFFNDHSEWLNKKYDIILLTEVIEHLCHPTKELQNLCQLLKNNGSVIVMTQAFKSDTDFANWHYRRDPTHVTFYQKKTFEILAENLRLKLTHPHPFIFILSDP